MKSKLSREDIDKLLGVDSTERIPTTVEIGLIKELIEAVAKQRNIDSFKISTNEINELIKKIGIENVKVYSKEEILGCNQKGN